MIKKSKVKSEPRNFGVVVLAITAAIFFTLLATSIYDGSWQSITSVIVLSFLAIISAMIALNGRLEPLKQFIQSIFYFPF